MAHVGAPLKLIGAPASEAQTRHLATLVRKASTRNRIALSGASFARPDNGQMSLAGNDALASMVRTCADSIRYAV